MCKSKFFLNFFNFSFYDILLRLGQKAIIIEIYTVRRMNRASHVKENNQERSGKVWRAITPENLNSLYKSLPRRMAAVIAEGESHNKYWCTFIIDIFIIISKEIHLLIGCCVFYGGLIVLYSSLQLYPFLYLLFSYALFFTCCGVPCSCIGGSIRILSPLLAVF